MRNQLLLQALPVNILGGDGCHGLGVTVCMETALQPELDYVGITGP